MYEDWMTDTFFFIMFMYNIHNVLRVNAQINFLILYLPKRDDHCVVFKRFSPHVLYTALEFSKKLKPISSGKSDS